MIKRVLFSLIAAASLSIGSGPAFASGNPVEAFSTLKGLTGVWRLAHGSNSAFQIRFSTAAAETVLVESWYRGEAVHSLTLYHRDLKTLIATHYCPQGNQPRLALTRTDRNTLVFDFRDATNLDVSRQSYLTHLEFVMLDPDTLVRRETYRENGKNILSELRLRRSR